MALVWQKKTGAANYEVRHSGHSIRLYRNQVLHSQWNPKDPLKGSFWELFLLASFYTHRPPKRILILGVGGGAAVKLLQRYRNSVDADAQIVGVESDKTHIKIAKHYFGISSSICELIHQDALAWVSQYEGSGFDLIIDDLFIEWEKEPQRAIVDQKRWYQRLNNLLCNRGGLVVNFADRDEWKRARKAMAGQRKQRFHSVAMLEHHKCQNRIVLLAKENISLSLFKRNVLESDAKKLLKYLERKVFKMRLIKI